MYRVNRLSFTDSCKTLLKYTFSFKITASTMKQWTSPAMGKRDKITQTPSHMYNRYIQTRKHYKSFLFTKT